MIFGECPYDDCNNTHSYPLADECPVFQRLVCENCGRPMWMYHSRLDPIAYTDEGFFDEYDVDEETKVITPKCGK